MESVKLVLVPCATGDRWICELLREVLTQLAEGRPELRVVEAGAGDLAKEDAILALDACRECRAGDLLKSRRIKPLATLYLPDLIASRRLLDASRPLAEQREDLSRGLKEILSEEIENLLGQRRDEATYFEEILPVAKRYQKEIKEIEAIGSPAEEQPTPPSEAAERLGLAANRFRNMFMRCDEITPPPQLAALHDVFQDACLCATYGLQHWERAEWRKAQEYFEQAGHQAGPLLRHKALKLEQ